MSKFTVTMDPASVREAKIAAAMAGLPLTKWAAAIITAQLIKLSKKKGTK